MWLASLPLLVPCVQDPEPRALVLGELRFEIHVSRTAHLFHVVDQISAWSQFCHLQYLDGIDAFGPGDDEALEAYRAIRVKYGWGQGLEQTFYTPLELPDALAAGVEAERITLDEAGVLEEVLLHFADRVDELINGELARLSAFEAQVLAERELLDRWAVRIGRWVEAPAATVPVFLLANPSDHDFGGGFNGGRLTLEVPRKAAALGTFVHELFHAILGARQAEIERAIDGVVDYQTLNEGLAHAVAPGLVHPGMDGDPLAERVREVERRGQGLDEYKGRIYRYAIVLRPLVERALEDEDARLMDALPSMLDLWRGLVELEGARR